MLLRASRVANNGAFNLLTISFAPLTLKRRKVYFPALRLSLSFHRFVCVEIRLRGSVGGFPPGQPLLRCFLAHRLHGRTASSLRCSLVVGA